VTRETLFAQDGRQLTREVNAMPDWLEIITRLLAAALIGGGIGLNRHLHHKDVGLRTLSLVSCGAAGLVLASFHAAGRVPNVDAMSPVMQGIMTGVGVIGAGVMMRRQSDEKIHGLSTAATVWITAALGALCGIGEWKIIIILSLIIAMVLLTGGSVERWCDAAYQQAPRSARLSWPRPICVKRSDQLSLRLLVSHRCPWRFRFEVRPLVGAVMEGIAVTPQQRSPADVRAPLWASAAIARRRPG
jgi:putative Mg2+ transporter-C (MgtC) family protein